MESLQAIALKAIANPMEEAKKLHEKHPLARDLCKEEHKRKFRQVMSQPICLSTCPCAEWCYLYGQSLAFGGIICQHFLQNSGRTTNDRFKNSPKEGSFRKDSKRIRKTV